MKIAGLLFFAHLFALVFGLIGMLVMIPNPQIWVGSPAGVQVFTWGMQYAGALHILLGAAAMAAIGVACLGWRRTFVFLAISTTLSLSAELFGTATGWPFGGYSYTTGLGFKILDRVPYTIPLSWFYMGFASYLLAGAIVGSRGLVPRATWSVLLGAWFLTVWDLVLDPSMAHESLPIKFWEWHEGGAYFGMPVQNFLGWFATGTVFIGLSRLLWSQDVGPDDVPAWIPLGVYAANLLFAMVISASVGLWIPIVAAILLGLVPAAFVYAPSIAAAPQSISNLSGAVTRSGSR